MEHPARADDPIDNWRIGHLRQQPRRPRGADVVEQLLRPREVPSIPDRLEAAEDAIFELAMRLDAVELEQRRAASRSSDRTGPAAPHPAPESPPTVEPEPGHTFFVPSPEGYEIVEAEGAAPVPGTSVTLGAHRYAVQSRRRTPFPSDGRPCLVLARVPTAPVTGSG